MVKVRVCPELLLVTLIPHWVTTSEWVFSEMISCFGFLFCMKSWEKFTQLTCGQLHFRWIFNAMQPFKKFVPLFLFWVKSLEAVAVPSVLLQLGSGIHCFCFFPSPRTHRTCSSLGLTWWSLSPMKMSPRSSSEVQRHTLQCQVRAGGFTECANCAPRKWELAVLDVLAEQPSGQCRRVQGTKLWLKHRIWLCLCSPAAPV